MIASLLNSSPWTGIGNVLLWVMTGIIGVAWVIVGTMMVVVRVKRRGLHARRSFEQNSHVRVLR